MIRATSLSGVANHYVSISPGPNSNPALDEGADARPRLDHHPGRPRPALQHLPAQGAPRPRQLHQGQRRDLRRARPRRRTSLQVLRRRRSTAPAPSSANSTPTNGSSRASSSAPPKLSTAVAGRGDELSSAISNANTAFGAIASQNVALDRTLRQLPPIFRQANTTFVNLRAALDDLDPLVETAKPATKDLAPFLAELRPVVSKAVPVFKNLRLTVTGPGNANDAAELLATLPTVQQRASKAFPHAEDAIAAFQPNLNFARAYTPDLFNGFAKLGQVTGYYDGNGHYVRGQLRRPQPLQLRQRQRPGTDHAERTVRRLRRLGRRQAALPRRRHPARRRRLQPVRRTAVRRLRRHHLRLQPRRRAARTMRGDADRRRRWWPRSSSRSS